MLKPVYLRNRDLNCDRKQQIYDYALLESVQKCISDIQCIQKDRDLWRIYVGSQESRQKLLIQGFEFNNTTVCAFETNPFSAGTSSPSESVIKITVKGVPLSVDDTEITKMLESFKVSMTSPLKYEKIRHPVTRKMTGILNGNRFAYAKPLPDGKYLPRTTFCAGLKCFVYHEGQPSNKRKPLCTNCWQDDHFRHQCKNQKCCKVCRNEGHEPGSEMCDFYVPHQKNVVAFSGKDSIASNFYPCSINVFGVKHRSAEHAFQYVKALRCGDLPRDTAIQEAETPMEAMRIGKDIMVSEQFLSKQEEIMTEIVEAKAKQVKDFKEILLKNGRYAVNAESTYNDYWGTGLDRTGTTHTDMKNWPGKNRLGRIISDIAAAQQSNQRSWSVPRKSAKPQDKQVEITQMLKTARSRKRSRGNRNSHEHSSRDSSPRQRSKSVRRCQRPQRDPPDVNLGSNSESDRE